MIARGCGRPGGSFGPGKLRAVDLLVPLGQRVFSIRIPTEEPVGQNEFGGANFDHHWNRPGRPARALQSITEGETGKGKEDASNKTSPRRQLGEQSRVSGPRSAPEPWHGLPA